MSNEAIGGWAPGNYYNRCLSCEGLFTGDRLATQCEPCALRDRIAELQGRIDAAIKIVYGQGKPELKASRMLEVLEQGAALREGWSNERNRKHTQ